MSKKLFVISVVLMSLALVGIICIQAYYINNSIKTKNEQFAYSVKKTLNETSTTIEDREYNDYFVRFLRLWRNMKAEGVAVDTTAIRTLYIVQDGINPNETLIYRNGILEENYKLTTSLFDIGLDSINIKRVLNERETKVLQASDEEFSLQSGDFQMGRTTRIDELQFETTYKDNIHRVPLHKRVTRKNIDWLLERKFKEDNIDIDYEFAIYSNDLATKVQSDNFELNKASTFSVPIFRNENSRNNYSLLVNFPKKEQFILSSVLGVTVLSVIFTAIIVMAYVNALRQLLRQRKISEIKSDFINNMTHEFKTPIATINLALDAIRNPKTIDDKDKVMRYLNMIKDENKRMHAQVENVLRISKLEKNELNINKERVKLHDLIDDAVSHIELIVEDRGGFVKKHLDADKSSILANESHFTNVLVNMLDNAVKYSPSAPEIDVYTENAGNNIILKITDKGSGMSKTAQKRVFEKFYREHTGNIHNVKGHGLGLAYVKRIVDDHQGHISVASEKGKGSTFTISLPLIS